MATSNFLPYASSYNVHSADSEPKEYTKKDFKGLHGSIRFTEARTWSSSILPITNAYLHNLTRTGRTQAYRKIITEKLQITASISATNYLEHSVLKEMLKHSISAFYDHKINKGESSIKGTIIRFSD